MTVLFTNGTVFVDEGLRKQAAELVDRMADPGSVTFALAAEGGSATDVSPDLNAFLLHVLRGLARGGVAVTTLPDELTTTVAAELVGVSRPTLMKLVRSGELRSRQVGSHTRLRTSDVLELRRARAHERRRALDALRELDEQFGE